MKNLKPILISILFILVAVANLFGEVKLPRIFSSNMVLQQGIEIPVWGWADKSERITIEFKGETYKAKANKEGKWMVKLPSQEYGGPYSIAIAGKKNKIQFDNVMIGEVWICSGQSNMEMPVELCNNPEREIPAAVYPDIRFFTVPRVTSKYPMSDIESGQWEECTPETAKGFTGVGYFFGRELHQELDVPIGLIHTSWGGTIAETWMSTETIENDIDLKHPLKELQETDLSNYAELQRNIYIDNIAQIFNGEIPSKDKGLVNGEAVWAAEDFDDSNWFMRLNSRVKLPKDISFQASFNYQGQNKSAP